MELMIKLMSKYLIHNRMIEEFSKKLEEAKNAFKEIPIDDMN
jgi:hypothetical protein